MPFLFPPVKPLQYGLWKAWPPYPLFHKAVFPDAKGNLWRRPLHGAKDQFLKQFFVLTAVIRAAVIILNRHLVIFLPVFLCLIRCLCPALFFMSTRIDQEPTSGNYYLDCYKDGAEEIYSASVQQKKYIRNYLLGMVYQNPHLGLRMFFSTGANVAEKLIAAGGRNVDGMMGKTKELLNHMEVPVNRVKEPPRNFSGGMQQRVQIAKAVANHPPILFLDEVTTGLDLSVQAKVLDRSGFPHSCWQAGSRA